MSQLSRGAVVKVNRSLIRPLLFCGAEKKVSAIYGLITISIALATRFHPPGIFLAPLIFISCHLFFMWLAKRDPQMIAIYSRHIRYNQGYFPACGGARSLEPKTRKSVYQKKE